MIKGLFVGDGGVYTGFARVIQSIINFLPEDEYELHHLAVNYRGDPWDSKAEMYPAMLGGDIYGIRRLAGLVEKIEPDFVFILNDTWILDQYLQAIDEDVDYKIITYFPVDAKPINEIWSNTIVARTQPVAYTEFGRNAILDNSPDADVRIIPHGIDTDIFYPVDINEARRGLKNLTEEDFLVLNANRNQPRKRVDLTIKGFAKFAEGKPDSVKLYLHMGMEDIGWHIGALCQRYGIAKRLVLTSQNLSPSNGVSVERLNLIYNSSNIGLNTSMGEGWGLCSFEHGACKRAQVVPNSSANTELYTGRAILMPIDHYDTYPRILTDGAVVSEDSVAEALEEYYQNPEKRTEDANKVYEFITQPKFSWKYIAQQWHELFQEVIARD